MKGREARGQKSAVRLMNSAFVGVTLIFEASYPTLRADASHVRRINGQADGPPSVLREILLQPRPQRLGRHSLATRQHAEELVLMQELHEGERGPARVDVKDVGLLAARLLSGIVLDKELNKIPHLVQFPFRILVLRRGVFRPD